MTPVLRRSIASHGSRRIGFARDRRVSARWAEGIWVAILFVACLTVLTPAAEALDVPKWRRHVIALTNSSYSGNPFEVVLDATFTHTASGTQLTLPGYYNGSDRWEIGFMPTKLGTWSWVTSSPDPDLAGRTGSLVCVASGHPGMLTRDPLHPRKWKFTDGAYAVPMAFRMDFFVEPASDAEFAETADFLSNGVRGHLLETRLLEEYGRFDGRTDFIFEGDWWNHRFDLVVWNRMARRMEMLTERGLGAHVMFYSDDIGVPDWDGRSPTEALVIRYAVARLAGYPTVWFNTGIDIGEYRNDADIDWFGERIADLDPYDHPRSSRTFLGDSSLTMDVQSFKSEGSVSLALVETMIDEFLSSNGRPISMDDGWGENRTSHPSKLHTPSDIRRGFWKGLVAGGVGGLVRGGDELSGSYDGFFSIGMFEEELESEQWLRLIPPFLSNRLGETFARMVPAPSLDANLGVHALADPQHTKILFLAVGDFDSYDSGGVDLALQLGGISGEYSAVWFDPRTGNESPAGTFQGGNNYVVPPPSLDDWLLLLTSNTACDAPDPLMAATRDGGDVLLAWAASSDPDVAWNVYRGNVPDPTLWGAAPDTNVPDDDPGTPTMHQYRDANAAASGQPSYYYLRTTVTSCGESGNPSLLP